MRDCGAPKQGFAPDAAAGRMQTMQMTLRAKPLVARKGTKASATRRAPVIRAYVVEKDQPPTQTGGSGREPIKVGINGE